MGKRYATFLVCKNCRNIPVKVDGRLQCMKGCGVGFEDQEIPIPDLPKPKPSDVATHDDDYDYDDETDEAIDED